MEVHTGSAYNVDTNLRIDPGYDLTAHYATNAFEGGPYYSVRFGKWRDQNGWEVEFLHHKVYLENTPAGIQTFRIANGYNMLFLNRGWKAGPVVIRAGGGPLIAFPIANINGIITDGGYRVAGIASQVAAATQFRLSGAWYFSLEGKFTFGYASVDLNGGFQAKVPNAALHALAGIGVEF